MKKKKVIAGVVLVAVIAAGGSGVVVWKKVQDGTLELSFLKKSDKTEGSVYVDSVEKILNPDVSGTNQRFSGVIEPQKTWKIEASSDKKIKEIYVAEGDQVKAGQDLFTYDTSEAEENLVDAQIELDRLNSDIETTQKQIDTMNKELANVKDEDQRLEYTNLIQTKENSLKKSQYDLKKQNVTIEQLKNTIANATVQSEMDGIVKSINEDAGSSSYGYSSNDDSNAFMTILSAGNYRVKATANEQNRSAVQAGLPVIVHSRVNDDETWSGTMGSLDTEKTAQNNNDNYNYGSSSNDSSSSNYNFYVELDDSSDLILGQHVYVEIDNGQYKHQDGVWLNSYYIIQNGDGTGYVWAADSQDKMEERKVTLGEYDEELDLYEITDGLTREDYIAFPSSDIQAGMTAERNIDNATIGTGAASATGIGDGETYIGGDYSGYSDYSEDDGLYDSGDYSLDETGEEYLDTGEGNVDDLSGDEAYYDDGVYTDDGELLDDSADDGVTNLDGEEETAASGEE